MEKSYNGKMILLDEDSVNYDIKLAPTGKLSNTEQDLYLKMEKLCIAIKFLYKTPDQIKKQYFSRVVGAIKVGLIIENPQPDLASKALSSLKENILYSEGKKIKNKYMIELLTTLSPIMLILLILYFIFCINKIVIFNQYIFGCIGALIGIFISYGARKYEFQLEDLIIIEKDLMSPFIRSIYILLCTIVFILFINTGFLELKIINTSLHLIFKENIEAQIAIGVICGLIESKLGKDIHKKAEQFMD